MTAVKVCFHCNSSEQQTSGPVSTWQPCQLSTAAAGCGTDLHATFHLSDPDFLLLPHISDLRCAIGLWIETGGFVHHVAVYQNCVPYIPFIWVHPVVTRWQFWMCHVQVTTCLGRVVSSPIRSPETFPLVLQCFVRLHDEGAAITVTQIWAKHACRLITTEWVRTL